MLYCRRCREDHELKERAFFLLDETCDICGRRFTLCYFDQDLDISSLFEENEDG